MAFFDHVTPAPPDPILGLTQAFNSDPRDTKVNLTVGYYRDSNLKTVIMSSVKKAEKILYEKEKNKDYLPIDGDKDFIEKVGSLVFTDQVWQKEKKRIVGVQSVGGTGTLRVGGEFLKQEVGSVICLSDPTWPNHKGVFQRCGMKIETYPYYDMGNHTVDFDRMRQYLNALPPKATVLLHACCHNPTGADFSEEQWKELSDVFLKKELVPFFDLAYQGLGRGWDEDAASVRYFIEAGHEMLVASSFSKNFSLYGERVGALFLVTNSEKAAQNVTSKIKTIIRPNYSNPPRHGGLTLLQVLSDPLLKKEWEDELTSMRKRILEMRKALTEGLVAKSKNTDYRYLSDRYGLFCFCALQKEQVEKLIKEYGIYMTSDGRINVVGLNKDNLDYVINAIVAVS